MTAIKLLLFTAYVPYWHAFNFCKAESSMNTWLTPCIWWAPRGLQNWIFISHISTASTHFSENWTASTKAAFAKCPKPELATSKCLSTSLSRWDFKLQICPRVKGRRQRTKQYLDFNKKSLYIDLPEHHNNRAFAASNDDQPLPYHKGRRHYHRKV